MNHQNNDPNANNNDGMQNDDEKYEFSIDNDDDIASNKNPD